MNKTKTNAKAHKSLREPQRLYSLELLNSSCKHFTVQWTMGRHCAWVSLILHFEVVQFLKFWYKCFMHSVLQLKLCLTHTNFHSTAFLWVPPEINSHDWLLVIFLACLWAYFFFPFENDLIFFFWPKDWYSYSKVKQCTQFPYVLCPFPVDSTHYY